MRQVPFLNLNELHRQHRAEFVEAFSEVLDNSAFIGGKALSSFEKGFGEWLGDGIKTIGCANGTEALSIAAKGLELNENAEAILPAMTFFATAEALLSAGIKIKLVDIDPKTRLMDLDQLESAISANTKLLVPVHLYGQMVDMERVKKIADAKNCLILEDAAQAHGARWNGHSPGYYGNCATFSFFPGKNLGAFGDGGGIASRDPEFLKRSLRIASHGGLKKYEHDVVGYNSRLDNLHAAFLNIKLKYLNEWNEKRRTLASFYNEALQNVEEIGLPFIQPKAVSVHHLFVITVPDREALGNHLKEKGIATGIHYPKALHELPALSHLACAKENYPHSSHLAAHSLSLPMCPTLKVEDVNYVVSTIKEYFA